MFEQKELFVPSVNMCKQEGSFQKRWLETHVNGLIWNDRLKMIVYKEQSEPRGKTV
jgi:hypothetical protein